MKKTQLLLPLSLFFISLGVSYYLFGQGGFLMRTRPTPSAHGDVRHVSVFINRHPNAVYHFVSSPKNLPKWANGLGSSIKQLGNDWVADSPMGTVKVVFAEKNDLGVLDHQVILNSGVSFYNPMRVVAHGHGSEVIFTLFRQPGMSPQKFNHDVQWVENDLQTLKRILEKRPEPRAV